MWLSRLSNSEYRTPMQFLDEICADAVADYLAAEAPEMSAGGAPTAAVVAEARFTNFEVAGFGLGGLGGGLVGLAGVTGVTGLAVAGVASGAVGLGVLALGLKLALRAIAPKGTSIPPVLAEQLRHFPETECRLLRLLVRESAAVKSVKWPAFMEVMEGLTTRVAPRDATAESMDSEIDGEISAALQQLEEDLQTKGADEALSIFIEAWLSRSFG